MFSLNNYPQIISYLKSTSGIFRNISSTEVVMFCPYCDDATRKINPTHGHLYLSVNYPVFHCFRCETSGSLYQLLLDVGYPNLSDIEELRSTTKIKTTRDHGSKLISKEETSKNIDEIFKFKKEHPNLFSQYEQYIKLRTGMSDFIKFGLWPDIIDKSLVVNFYNQYNELNCSRFIDDKTKRYKKYETPGGFYFFQKWNLEKYKEITLCEGPFDIINLYLYNPILSNSLFLSILGKKYISSVDRLLETDLTIGKYKLNIIFDKDVTNHDFILNKISWICNKINPRIDVRGYLPEIGKDAGTYPIVIEV